MHAPTYNPSNSSWHLENAEVCFRPGFHAVVVIVVVSRKPALICSTPGFFHTARATVSLITQRFSFFLSFFLTFFLFPDTSKPHKRITEGYSAIPNAEERLVLNLNTLLVKRQIDNHSPGAVTWEN